MMNEETKASLNKFLKEREERIKNMTLAEARDTVSRIYGHSDMRMESDKALQMLLDCADKTLEQTRWIPVSERLPEDYGEYICTMNDDNVQECGFVPIGEKGLIPGWSTCEADGFKKLDYRDVIAWMPLPQHYKEESVDEE